MALRFSWRLLLATSVLIVFPSRQAARAADEPAAGEAVIDIERPSDRQFTQDLANLIKEPELCEIGEITDRLWTDKSIPIVVVTIGSMADHCPFKLRIETFAHLLFDQWQIGPAEVNGQDWNRGILLLVSQRDRKARIELGAGWRRDQDRQCQRIMQERIVPHFKQGDYSGGILAGVKALDGLARVQAHPAALPAAASPQAVAAPEGVDPQQLNPQLVPPHVPAPHAIRLAPAQFPAQQQFPRAWPQPLVPPPRVSNGLPIAVLIVIGVVAVVVISKLASSASTARRRGFGPLGARHVTQDSFWGGPFGWQNWGLYEMSRQNWQHQDTTTTHSASSFSDGGMSHGGGGFSGGGSIDAGSSASSFDGGSSGGGGATGSW